MTRQIMTGNEAIARGAWEAGCAVAAAYPGTPSSEILENIAEHYREIAAEWSTNEKVAAEIAAGASIAGARSLCAMKHVGLNVAADPVFTMSYIGATGGMVIVTADDPGLFSSQNEQDNRWYALHAKLPMLEPSDSEECLLFTRAAFDISERFDVPVLLRVTTRICHSKGIVELGEREGHVFKKFEHDRPRRVMAPASAKVKRYAMEERERELRCYSSSCRFNVTIPAKRPRIGVITSGISYMHAREAFLDRDDVSFLKLGFTYPLPGVLIKDFASELDEIYVIEENEPYIENFVKALGIKCVGRRLLPAVDELSAGIVRRAFLDEETPVPAASVDAVPPPRPPVLCPGCSHRGIFHELAKLKDIAVSSDIGCYTLGATPPFNVGDSVICMGAGVSAGIGMTKAFRAKADGAEVKKVFGVIGDSTFFHSGITGLIDAAMNKSDMALCILDNRITAMTGHQDNPGTGKTIYGEDTAAVDLVELCAACGVKRDNIRRVDPYDLKDVKAAIKDACEATELFVIITTQPCALIKDVQRRRANTWCEVDEDRCAACGKCVKVLCPAISAPKGGKPKIERSMCNGCTVCAQVCSKDAIKKVGDIVA